MITPLGFPRFSSNNFGDFPTVSNGSSGNYVKFLQANLDITQNPGGIDGIFGSNTRSAVIAYQRANNLTADGIVGPQTFAFAYLLTFWTSS